jgi:hypothetical protein
MVAKSENEPITQSLFGRRRYKTPEVCRLGSGRVEPRLTLLGGDGRTGEVDQGAVGQ